MKETTRKLLDWVQLPATVLWAAFGHVDKSSLNKLDEVNNFRTKTTPFKIVRWLISKRLQP